METADGVDEVLETLPAEDAAPKSKRRKRRKASEEAATPAAPKPQYRSANLELNVGLIPETYAVLRAHLDAGEYEDARASMTLLASQAGRVRRILRIYAKAIKDAEANEESATEVLDQMIPPVE